MLELRQRGGVRELVGRFPYRAKAIMSDRGRVRKETFNPRAFDFSINQELDRRIDILVGHDFGKPVASRQSGTLAIQDGDDAVSFVAQLPNPAPSWVDDMERSIEAGIMTGLSPGFRIPPRAVVPNAEVLIPEVGNPGVAIRQINHAVLREFSVVTSAAYVEAAVELRAEDMDGWDYDENTDLIIPGAMTIWL